MKKILITGGAGLIGQMIAVKHINEGDDVYIYDNKSNVFNDYGELAGEDITSFGSIEEVVKENKFDIISHQAANVGVGESQYMPAKYVENNCLFTSRLLQAIINCRDNHPELFILAGSMGPYGEGPYICKYHNEVYPLRNKAEDPLCPYCLLPISPIKIKESAQRYPKSIYALTKMMQEDMVKIMAESYKIPSVSLRYFSVYGINSNPNNPYTGVLSIIGNKILNNSTIDLYEDGNQTRDLISANEVAVAHYLSSKFCTPQFFEEYNIGTGKSIRMADVANRMVSNLAPWKKINYTGDYRSGDVRHSCADIEKFKAKTGWHPCDEIYGAIDNYCRFLRDNRDKFTKIGDTSLAEHENLMARKLI